MAYINGKQVLKCYINGTKIHVEPLKVVTFKDFRLMMADGIVTEKSFAYKSGQTWQDLAKAYPEWLAVHPNNGQVVFTHIDGTGNIDGLTSFWVVKSEGLTAVNGSDLVQGDEKLKEWYL